MFAYCRNNPTSRTDISGTYDIECDTSNPLDTELPGEDDGRSGGAQAQGQGKGYTAPNGGGGITTTIRIGSIKVEFGHGARHLENTGYTANQVEQIIAQDVVAADIPLNTYYPGHVKIGNTMFRYSGFRLTENRINVGTYYLEH